MSRSSIFSFNTLQVASLGRGLIGKGAVLCAALLISVDIGLRWFLPSDHRPSGSAHNVELRDQQAQLAEMAEPIDLMITGSSVAAVNLRPSVIDRVAAESGSDFRSFNAGIRGCDYGCIGPGFWQWFWREKQARVVALVVSPVDLNDANRSVRQRSEDFLRSFEKPSLQRFMEDTLRHWWLFGFRAEIKTWLGEGQWHFEPSKVTTQGHTDMGSEPEARYQWRYRFDQTGPTFLALARLIEQLQQAQVGVILVPGLMDGATWQAMPDQQRQDYDQLLQQLSGLAGVVTVSTPTSPADGDFIDQLHLSSEASKAYSRAIAPALVSAAAEASAQFDNKMLKNSAN